MIWRVPIEAAFYPDFACLGLLEHTCPAGHQIAILAVWLNPCPHANLPTSNFKLQNLHAAMKSMQFVLSAAACKSCLPCSMRILSGAASDTDAVSVCPVHTCPVAGSSRSTSPGPTVCMAAPSCQASAKELLSSSQRKQDALQDAMLLEQLGEILFKHQGHRPNRKTAQSGLVPF